MLNRFLYRLLPIFLSTSFIIISCGPSPEEKARRQALRDSASIDSALKLEIETAHLKSSEKAKKVAFIRDSLKKAKQLKLDSINQSGNPPSSSSDSMMAGSKRLLHGKKMNFRDSVRFAQHRDSLLKGLNKNKTHRDSLLKGLSPVKTHRDSILKGLIHNKTHRDSLLKGLTNAKTHRDSLIKGFVRNKTHRDSVIMGLVHKKPLSHLDSVRRRQRLDSLRKARLSDTSKK